MQGLTELLPLLEAVYPHEGCGLILEGPAGTQVVPLRNVHPTPDRAFAFDPSEHLAVLRRADLDGARVTTHFHSHCDAPAVFSADDRAHAAPAGDPLFPGVRHLVVSVRHARSVEARLFWFEGSILQHQQIELPSNPK